MQLLSNYGFTIYAFMNDITYCWVEEITPMRLTQRQKRARSFTNTKDCLDAT